jgi:hypothetical protein
METLKQKLTADLKEALKSKDELRASTLRMVISAVFNKEIEVRKKDIGLSDEEILTVLSSEVKKRKDAIREFENGGRSDLADKEKLEMAILVVYLPEQMPDEEIARIVKDGVREVGATSEKDFSKVMKIIMPIMKGKADGDRVSAAVREALKAVQNG